MYFLSAYAPAQYFQLSGLNFQVSSRGVGAHATKKDGPEGISPLGAVKPGDVLLSHNL